MSQMATHEQLILLLLFIYDTLLNLRASLLKTPVAAIFECMSGDLTGFAEY